jgi:hypothetical protein
LTLGILKYWEFPIENLYISRIWVIFVELSKETARPDGKEPVVRITRTASNAKKRIAWE